MLSSCIDFHPYVTIECLYFDLTSQNSVCYAYVKIGVNICSVSFEVGMRLDLHLDHQVSSWTTKALISLLRYS